MHGRPSRREHADRKEHAVILHLRSHTHALSARHCNTMNSHVDKYHHLTTRWFVGYYHADGREERAFPAGHYLPRQHFIRLPQHGDYITPWYSWSHNTVSQEASTRVAQYNFSRRPFHDDEAPRKHRPWWLALLLKMMLRSARIFDDTFIELCRYAYLGLPYTMKFHYIVSSAWSSFQPGISQPIDMQNIIL